MGTIIKVVCMYCDKDMGTKDGQGMSGTSHGICKECMKKSDAELEVLARAKHAKRLKTFGNHVG